MDNKDQITVTSPLLPDLDEFNALLKEIWESKWITNNGSFHRQLEKELAAYLKVPYISLFTNGTLPLITALQALRITGEVITTPYSFVATTHALWWNGIKPVFVDVDSATGNIDPNKIEAAITPRTTAIMPVHVYGKPCDTKQIQAIADKYGLKVIYDAAHAFGVEVDGESVLNAGDLSTLSFHATKVYNTIEGGAMVMQDEKMKQRIDYLKNFGFAGETEVVAPGINSKMDEIRSAYGLLNLRQVNSAIEARRKAAVRYRENLRNVEGISFFDDTPGVRHNYSYFPIFVDAGKYGTTRDELYAKLRGCNILGRRYFYPLISEFTTYRSLPSAKPENLPNARKMADSVICLPMHHELTEENIDLTISINKKQCEMIEVSELSKKVQPTLTRHLFNLAKAYDDVIDFTLGDPDIPPHQAIKDAGCLAIQQGKTRYSQNAGLLELRQVISSYYQRTENLVYDPVSEIMVTVGAMEGLYLALLSILNPGDEVIIPAPYYVNYAQMTLMCHATPVIIDDPTSKDLTFRVEDMERAITDKTKAIIINTPSNPSGKIIPSQKIAEIAAIAKKHDLIVLSDEVYKCLIYDGSKFRSIVEEEGMRERTILINSLSKEFCMTGWRIGYVLAPEEVIATMTKLQENIAACVPLPSQYAAIKALGGEADYSGRMVEIFLKRRNLLVDGISKIPRLACSAPEATFYLMVDISATGMTSEQFAVSLLKEAHVAVVPGITYGKCCDSYVRIAFTLDENKIKEGLQRIHSFIERLV